MYVHQKNTGFTLVELLIVVAIVGILSAIAIPQYTKYKKNAAVSAAQSSIKNCVNNLAAAYSISSSSSDTVCDVGQDTIGLEINNTGIIIEPPESYTVSGYSITCQVFADGTVTCKDP